MKKSVLLKEIKRMLEESPVSHPYVLTGRVFSSTIDNPEPDALVLTGISPCAVGTLLHFWRFCPPPQAGLQAYLDACRKCAISSPVTFFPSALTWPEEPVLLLLPGCRQSTGLNIINYETLNSLKFYSKMVSKRFALLHTYIFIFTVIYKGPITWMTNILWNHFDGTGKNRSQPCVSWGIFHHHLSISFHGKN